MRLCVAFWVRTYQPFQGSCCWRLEVIRWTQLVSSKRWFLCMKLHTRISLKVLRVTLALIKASNLAVFKHFNHTGIIYMEHRFPFFSPCTKFISEHNGTVFITPSGCPYGRMFCLKMSWVNFLVGVSQMYNIYMKLSSAFFMTVSNDILELGT